MLAGIATLLVCQLVGEAVVSVVSLPIPGPVLGMVLLFGLMVARAPVPAALGDPADGLLRNLSLPFVPAGVGVVQHLGRLALMGYGSLRSWCWEP